MIQYEKLAECLTTARKAVVFSGAGTSTRSGLPDFRSSQGLWTHYDPMALASVEAMNTNRQAFLEFYRYRIKSVKRAAPNAAHHILAEWEKHNLVKGVITQNVDGFHQEAGSMNVIELHGSLRNVQCRRCMQVFSSDLLLEQETCPMCDGDLRPGVVLFGELLPEGPMEEARKLSTTCDLFIVLGSSLNVSPANLFPVDAYRNGAQLVIINKETTQFDSVASFVIHENLVDVLKEIHHILYGEGGF
ncbi:NAD-dependent deacylase [Aminobacterium sp. MB27-C1]|jgi:NAD-dependent deacetylase|uniref:SIR2 family NAD-dependent protein deacylase n=1 Tax=Aminobacterium sp. MB27-C1 TaxID=3070661 RepID=UPI001BCC253C|nr:NAD-dependent deacylase [Aminobacterium sp. MB27-C1]WMI72240.1 NAD-dependent deacylase [Aminobacterium sp. MB27-C1]